MCCWEIGAGYGHLFRLFPLVCELLDREHEVLVVVPDNTHASQVFEQLDITLLPAPTSQAPGKNFSLSLNYAQNLLRNGFWHAPTLQSRLRDWLALFDAYQPDFILAEHSPSALLAARLAGLRRAAIGTGFTIPRLVSPMPAIQPWFDIPQSHLLQIESEFLALVNPVLAELGGKPLANVADIFAGAEIFLCTFVELDHYSNRTQMPYCGPIVYSPPQRKPDWPTINGKRVFLYMRAANRYLRPLLDQLHQMSLSVLACVPDLPETEMDTLQRSHLHITTEPVDLQQVALDCCLMISQGGTNSGTLMLLSGVPVLVCPLELEQTLWAYRITAKKLGSMVNPFNPEPNYQAKIDFILNATEIRDQVQNFSDRYTLFDSRQSVREIANRITISAESQGRLA